MAQPIGPMHYGVPEGHPDSREMKTLWIGDIDHYMDESYVGQLFGHTGEVANVKIIRDKVTGYPAGYGFVEFNSHYAAQRVLETYNGREIPGTGRCYRLNWASFGINEKRTAPIAKPDSGPEYSIFVGDLAPDVTDYVLQTTFSMRYRSVKSAKVVTDPHTGISRGYGFVRFASDDEMKRAMVEMHGAYCSSRPMRISNATPKKQTSGGGGGGGGGGSGVGPTAPPSGSSGGGQATLDANDPANTTIFVGGLDNTVTEDELRSAFQGYGELVYVKIPFGKGCGFVQYVHRHCAELALHHLHGVPIGRSGARVRLSWGRSPQSKTTSSSRPAAAAPAATAYSHTPAVATGYDYSGYHGYDPHAGYGYQGGYYDYSQQHAATGYSPAPTATDGAAAAYGATAYDQQQYQQPAAAAPSDQTYRPPYKEEEKEADLTAPVNVEEENQRYMEQHMDSFRCGYQWRRDYGISFESDNLSTDVK